MTSGTTPAIRATALKAKAAAAPQPAIVKAPPTGTPSPTPPSANTFDFPNTTFGAAPVTQEFQFTNGESVAIRVTSAGLSSPTPQLWSTTISGLDGQLVQPGESLTFTVTFTPPAAPS